MSDQLLNGHHQLKLFELLTLDVYPIHITCSSIIQFQKRYPWNKITYISVFNKMIDTASTILFLESLVFLHEYPFVNHRYIVIIGLKSTRSLKRENTG